MSASIKIDLYRDFAAGVYLPEAPFPPMTPYLPRTHCIRVCRSRQFISLSPESAAV